MTQLVVKATCLPTKACNNARLWRNKPREPSECAHAFPPNTFFYRLSWQFKRPIQYNLFTIQINYYPSVLVYQIIRIYTYSKVIQIVELCSKKIKYFALFTTVLRRFIFLFYSVLCFTSFRKCIYLNELFNTALIPIFTTRKLCSNLLAVIYGYIYLYVIVGAKTVWFAVKYWIINAKKGSILLT